MTTLRALLAGRLADGTSASEADNELNRAYGKVMELKDTSALGTVEPKGIKATQQAWLRYRDAFLALAKVAAPSTSLDALAAQLTAARTKELAAFDAG